jgi:class 3 adenylate cyclase/pimeloyl-ACP methyl ester carboxylesterase
VNQTATVVVLFCDLVESTALMTAIGDDAADLVRRGLFARLRAAVEGCGGAVVKTYGDGLMAIFQSSAAEAVRCADSLGDEARTVESPRPLELRVGIAAGEASEEDGDWFGTPVVEAARLCSAADPGEVLLSETARKLVGSRGGLQFTAVGRLSLKGLASPLPTYALGSGARRRRSPTLVRWVALGVVAAAVMAGSVIAVVSSRDGDGSIVPTVPGPRGYVPHLSDRPCTSEESAGDQTIRCQTLIVPEDRSLPKGRMVRLAVVRAPASGKDAIAIPTVLVGQNIITTAGDPLRSTSAQIRLAMRGRAGSDPNLACSEVDQSRATRFAEGWRDARELGAQMLDACLTRLQTSAFDLRQYDQADVADDVRDLASALGLKQINLQAFGDTARVAVASMHRYPGLLRAVLLVDPLIPPTSAVNNVPSLAEGSLSLLAQRCRANARCAVLAPNLVESVERLRQRLAEQPETTTVPNQNGQPVQVVVDDGRLMQAIYLALDNTPSIFGLVPSVIQSGDVRGPAALLVSVAPFVDPGAANTVEWCAEDAGTVTATQIQGQADALPRWQSLVDPSILLRCDRFGLVRVSDVSTAPTSDIPVFVVNGALNPYAPESAVSSFGAGLSHFQLLTLANKAVGSEGWPSCAHELRAKFLGNPNTHLDTKTCAAADPPIPFVTS